MPESDKDKQMAMNVLKGFLGGTSERHGSNEVRAESEAAYRTTYQTLIREAIDAMVSALGNAR